MMHKRKDGALPSKMSNKWKDRCASIDRGLREADLESDNIINLTATDVGGENGTLLYMSLSTYTNYYLPY